MLLVGYLSLILLTLFGLYRFKMLFFWEILDCEENYEGKIFKQDEMLKYKVKIII